MINLCSNNFDDIKNIGFNILGGIAVIGLERLIEYIRRKYRFYKIKRLFGQDVDNDFKLVYGQFVLNNVYDANGTILTHPFTKPGTSNTHSILDPVSFSDTKGAKYISSLIAKETGNYSELFSDQEIGNNPDLSYCSTGGYSNTKSLDILKSPKNSFFDFYVPNNAVPGIVDVETSETTINTDPDYDLGIIIKINNQYFPERTQICVAGLNIWGTSGAAWFLANKWREIYKTVGNKEFGLILKVKKNSDKNVVPIKYKIK